MNISALTDEELVALVKKGESWAMAVLYDRYARLVFSLARHILTDRDAAEEVVQEVFVKVWRRAGDYHAERGKFSSWLSQIAHHQAIDEVRRRRVRPSAPAIETEAVDPVDDHADAFEHAVMSAEHQRIMEALECIPPEQRVPIELAYFGGMTQEEIAEKLRQPLGTIKTRMRLGMQKLKDLLRTRLE